MIHKKLERFKRTQRDFLKETDSTDSYEVSSEIYSSMVEIYKCPSNIDCDKCEKTDKEYCSRECMKIESEVVFREYDQHTSFNFSVYADKNNIKEATNNLQSINKLIKFLSNFKNDYEKALEILKENVKNENKNKTK